MIRCSFLLFWNPLPEKKNTHKRAGGGETFIAAAKLFTECSCISTIAERGLLRVILR